MDDFNLETHVSKPNIVNEKSSFVVITYWWGLGRENKNTQRPCPEDLESLSEDQRIITRKPITYDAMIDKWAKTCKRAKCNYLEVRYPEFERKGMYQHAINYKPKFIRNALDACFPRNVLYIDGDMVVKKYPRLFDIPNIDYAGQGWNVDPREQYIEGDERMCLFPYIFETSGGIMFFSQSDTSKRLLDMWHEYSKQRPGKADDRLISMMINGKKMLLEMNTIQLPYEYLWFSIDFDNYNKSFFSKSRVIISHPECLTGEDRASSEGADKSRLPRNYDLHITNHFKCNLRDRIYEYILCPSKRFVSGLQPYLHSLSKSKKHHVIPYDKKYGARNKIAKRNKELAGNRCGKCKHLDRVYLVHPDAISHNIDAKLDDNAVVEIVHPKNTIAQILKHIAHGTDVVLIPNGSQPRHISKLQLALESNNELEFAVRNTNADKLSRYKKEYYLKLDKTHPMFFSAKSRVLCHLVTISESLSDLEKVFNSSFIFLSMIRCNFSL
jgi:hypothetical protein